MESKERLKNLVTGINEKIIIDGNINYCPSEYSNTSCITSADKNTPVVSAASVYAKVKRDNFMKTLDLKYPAYGFKHHVGYGTKNHLDALRIHGPLPRIHRYSFEPIITINKS